MRPPLIALLFVALCVWLLTTSRKRAEAERERMEGELRLSQRLEAVGQLAAGVAHEINTPMVEQTHADINEALRSTLVVAQNEYKYVADVETDFGDIPPVMCNVGELNQVFLNLIVNAAHAIGDTTVAGSSERGAIRVTTARDNEAAVITISDSGPGIPDEIRERIFDPFFTTKAVGKGTGQGLVIATSIVDRHGGSLMLESGRVTSFAIRLPIG